MTDDERDELTTTAPPVVVDDRASDMSVGSEDVQERLSFWGYRGVFPPGPAMQQWNDAEPGSAKRFLDMMHEEQLHRQAMERAEHELNKVVILNESRSERLGIAAGGIITLTAILGAVACVMSGHGGWGVVIALAEIVRRGATWAWGAKLRVEADERTPSARELESGGRREQKSLPSEDDGG